MVPEIPVMMKSNQPQMWAELRQHTGNCCSYLRFDEIVDETCL